MAELRTYEYGEGKDWNVKGAIAFGKGAVHEDFVGLQVDINRFAEEVGFKKVEADGFLGPKTVDAWNKIYSAAVAKDATATAEFPAIATKEQLASYAAHVRDWLQHKGSKIIGGFWGVR
jgi:hypothetical protein